MRDFKYVILGAGPAGLSFARRLLDAGESSFIVLEKEATAGGLCRSAQVDEAPLDIGGGHFLDTRRSKVLEFLFRFLPRSEWREFQRISEIHLASGHVLDYPIEANLWQLPIDEQVSYLESIARAGGHAADAKPERFIDWIRWKLGDRIAASYMIPYNRKMWGDSFEELGTHWLEKLPSVSFADTLRSCLERRPLGGLPGHATFFYPKSRGYGDLWLRIAESLGDRLRERCAVESVDIETKVVNGAFRGDILINTIPWPMWLKASELPGQIEAEIRELKHTSVAVEYHGETLPSKAQWIYAPCETLPHHRMLVRHNFLPEVGRGYWTEANLTRFKPSTRWHHVNEYAYPINTQKKPAAIRTILAWAAEKRIIGLGRWGEWEHMNSDVVVERGMTLADELLSERR